MQKQKLDLQDDGWCFACGKNNPIGLKLEFLREGDEYVVYFTPEKQHQGYLNVTHGGIVSTVLDEVMARFVYVLEKNAVTGELTVRFKKPAVIGVRLRFAGRIDKEEGRIIYTSANATTDDGISIATATAKMVKV